MDFYNLEINKDTLIFNYFILYINILFFKTIIKYVCRKS